MKKALSLAVTALLLLANTHLSAQNNDPVLFTVEKTPINVSEFKYIYTKTNAEKADFSEKSLKEYLDLYTKFKLKVQRARELKLDTITALKEELKGYRKQLADSYLTDREVTDKLVKEAFERSQYDLNVSHIMASLPKNATDTAVAFKKIMEIKKRLDKGEKFLDLVKESDDKNSAAQGGSIGFVTALLPDGFYGFESVAYNAALNKPTDIVRSPLGYHILLVSEKRAARGEMEGAHILIRKSKEGQIQLNAKNRIDSVYTALKAGADFNKLATSVSEDGYSSPRGGYLGYFGISRYEKSFEDAAFGLQKDGDFTEPFESAIGWHVIRRISRRPVEGYDIAKLRLKARIQKDARFEIAKSTLVERIKKDADYKENTDAMKAFLAATDSTFTTYNWQKAENVTEVNLFTFNNGDKGTNKELNEFMTSNANKRVNYGATFGKEETIKKMYAEWVNEKALIYEETQLEKKYPDFKSLMREYEEGILLFEAIKMNVWDKASQDSAGLQKFFDKNKDKYKWEERANVTIYSLADAEKAKIEDVKAYALNHTPQETLQKFNEKGDILSFRDETIEKGKGRVLNQMEFKAGSMSANETNRTDKTLGFLKIEKIIPVTTKTLVEARGYAIADYQDFLEKEWVAELQKAYKVKVMDKELKKLVKK